MGEFRDNHAHSNERYGLRIFHNMQPRKYPCQPLVYDPARPDDPYWQNPPVTANFYRLTSWKNGRAGAIAELIADIRFHDFMTVDNLEAGIEVSMTNGIGDNMPRVEGGTIVGRSQGN